MEFASLPKLEPSRNVSSKVISKSTEQQWTLSVCYVCKTSAVPFTVMISLTDNNYQSLITTSIIYVYLLLRNIKYQLVSFVDVIFPSGPVTGRMSLFLLSFSSTVPLFSPGCS